MYLARGIQSNQSISDVEQVPFESVCTCRRCDHGLARHCEKSEYKCCKKENRFRVMDGIEEGFYPTDREEISYVK